MPSHRASGSHRRLALIGAALAAVVAASVLAVTVANASTTPAVTGTQINACGNPILYHDLSGWGGLGAGAVTRDVVGDHPVAHWAFDTQGTQFYMPQVNVAAGVAETFAYDSRAVGHAGTAQVAVDWYDAANRYLSEGTGPLVTLPASTVTAGTWTRVAANLTPPANAVVAHPLGWGNFGGASGVDFKATACDYELTAGGTTPPPTTVPPTTTVAPPPTTTPAPTTDPTVPPTTDPTTPPTATVPPPTTTIAPPPPDGSQAAVNLAWGTPDAGESDEYNGTAVDLTKWALFGGGHGDGTASGQCSAGYSGNGQRCTSQTAEGAGFLTVTGTADGKTGGLYSIHGGFKYGRIEVRERAFDTGSSGAQYHAVPLLFPETADYSQAEIDFAERDVADPATELFVHHNGTQSECNMTIDSTVFHNYAVDWEPTFVKWYVDGALQCTVNASPSAFDSSNGGAQMDMFPSTGTTMRPAQEQVDWVRMYPSTSTTFD
jgi:hypothetical protein